MADTGLSRDDIEAAVTAGIVSEGAAKRLLAFGSERNRALALGEQLPLSRGMNDVFIVFGLGLLFWGWASATTSLVFVDGINYRGSTYLLGAAAFLYVVIWLLSDPLVRRRHTLLPSIALGAGLCLSASLSAFGLVATLSGSVAGELRDLARWPLTVFLALNTVLIGIYWWRFRTPFVLGGLVLAGYFLAMGLLAPGWSVFSQPGTVFRLTGSTGAGWLTLAFGLGTFALAMWFDASDRYRVARASQNGFWLHLVATVLTVNAVGTTLLASGGAAALSALAVFILVLIVVALIVDRGSLIFGGASYALALLSSVDALSFGTLILVGALIVLSGLFWAPLRHQLLKMPGLARLSPYLPPTPETL